MGAGQFYLIILVEQDELGVGQDAELPVPGAAVGVRALTAGESVSRRTFNIWKQKQLKSEEDFSQSGATDAGQTTLLRLVASNTERWRHNMRII